MSRGCEAQMMMIERLLLVAGYLAQERPKRMLLELELPHSRRPPWQPGQQLRRYLLVALAS